MSKRTLENVKKDKGFKVFDLIVYGVIILIVAVSFIAVFATKDKSPLTGIRVYVEDKVVFEYDFENNKVVEGEDLVVDNTEKSLQVRVSTDYGYNLIVIEKSGMVRIKDADCHGRDCVYSPEITDNNGIIFCSPHRLKIVPSSYDDGKVTI